MVGREVADGVCADRKVSSGRLGSLGCSAAAARWSLMACQSRSIIDAMPTIEDHLRGRPESVAEMFSQILTTAQGHGHVDVEVIAKGVVLHGSRRIFAGLVPRDRGLGGMLNLLTPREDARFTKVESLTKRIWYHRFFLTDPHQLDEKFLGWVREACDVGQDAASR
jgi:Domain of unknown function (DUF5655)